MGQSIHILSSGCWETKNLRRLPSRSSSLNIILQKNELSGSFWGCGCMLICLSHVWLCNTMDYSLPGSSVHGIIQARILEWVAISYSWGSSQLKDRTGVSCIAGRFFTIWATREASIHLNAEFQRIARRDKIAFLSDQCKEIEENNRMGKTRDLFKKIRDTKGTFQAKMGS